MIKLYHRETCHLCHDALALCRELKLVVEIIEIDDKPELGALYGLRIPVVALGERELDWPFDARQLSDFCCS